MKDFPLPLRCSAKSQPAPELPIPLDFDSFVLHQLGVWLWCSSLRLRPRKMEPGEEMVSPVPCLCSGFTGDSCTVCDRTMWESCRHDLNLTVLNYWEMQLETEDRMEACTWSGISRGSHNRSREQPYGSYPPEEMLCHSINVATNLMKQPAAQ